MGAEPKRWTVEEVHAACAHGERDFRNAYLSSLDLRGADLRGADFRGANLRGACLAGCQLGPTARWRPVQQVVVTLTATVTGIFSFVLSLLTAKLLTENDILAAFRLLGGLLLLAWLMTIARRGLSAVAFAPAMMLAVVIALTVGAAAAGISATTAGFNAGMVATVVVIVVTVASVNVAAVSVIGSRGAAIAATVATAAAAASADGVPSAIAAVGVGASVLSLSIHLRRRALAGAPRDAWLRSLALWLPGLGGVRFAGADLTNADLSQVEARGADLRGARLMHTDFRDARELHLARFDGPLHSVPLQCLVSGQPVRITDLAGQDLSGLALDGVDLQGTNLRGATLKDARLPGARFDEACLERADLCGTDLRGASFRGASLQGARVDISTFRRSEWTADELAELCERGAEVLGLGDFPESVRLRLLGENEGLTLYFSTRLSPFDKALVTCVIVDVLGRDTRCSSEFRVQGETAIVRLFDAPREDLERVAEALHLKGWEQAQVEQKALGWMLGMLQPADLSEGLSDLMGRRLDRMELREAPPEAGPAVLHWCWENPTQPGANRLVGPRPCRLFLIHAPNDREFAAELVNHLRPLVRQKLIDPFDETRLLAGDVAHDVRSTHLENADAIVVLVSSALFQDGPWYEQLTRALARQKDGARVIPVRVRALSWEGTELARLQPLPEEGPPVVGWPDRDQAWAYVVSGLTRALLNQARGQP
jgi:uncharacterized protein YjbI with pentapeptide repeats